MRPQFFRAPGEQLAPGVRDRSGNLLDRLLKVRRGLLGRVRLKQDVPAFEFALWIHAHVAVRIDAELVAKILRRGLSERALDLGLRPDVEGALALLLRLVRIDHAVGVLGRVESALRIEHVAQNVVQDLPGRGG